MPDGRAVLVLHGITMSGASMLRALGGLGRRLESLGFELVAPNAAHRMDAAELASLLEWLGALYAKRGQDAGDWFRDGRFWDGDEHFDWFRSSTDSTSGKKTYAALERSLEAVAHALREKDVRAFVGFSQGSAMGVVLAALAARGDARFRGLARGVFLTGFKPIVEHPLSVAYPIASDFSGLFVIGEDDAVFPGTSGYAKAFSRAFAGEAVETLVVPGLAHDVPAAPSDVERIAEFVARAYD